MIKLQCRKKAKLIKVEVTGDMHQIKSENWWTVDASKQ